MNVSIVWSGYVGTTVAACLAYCGHEIVSVDTDEAVIEDSNAGVALIHEPVLEGLVGNTAENACARPRTTRLSPTQR